MKIKKAAKLKYGSIPKAKKIDTPSVKYAKKERQEDGTYKLIRQGLPLEKRQIEVLDDMILINDIRTLKRRKNVNRTVPIPVNEQERVFVDALRAYLGGLSDEAALFPFTRQWAYKVLAKVGVFPHLMRHSRNTINVRHYDLSGHHLQKINGWSNSKSADSYMHLNVTDITAKMKAAQKK